MQYIAPERTPARRSPALSCVAAALALAPLTACSAPAPEVRYSEASAAAEPAARFYTSDAVLHGAVLRAVRRIEAAIGETGLDLVDLEAARDCVPFRADCGFELSFADVVYCFGDPEPALACTAQGGGGQALGIEMDAALTGEELDNRLIHELFHVITRNRAPHARDGLFMAYTLGDERISAGTLDAVCAHFSCSRFVVEETSE